MTTDLLANKLSSPLQKKTCQDAQTRQSTLEEKMEGSLGAILHLHIHFFFSLSLSSSQRGGGAGRGGRGEGGGGDLVAHATGKVKKKVASYTCPVFFLPASFPLPPLPPLKFFDIFCPSTHSSSLLLPPVVLDECCLRRVLPTAQCCQVRGGG